MKIFTSACWHFLLVFVYWTVSVSDAASQCPSTYPKDSKALSFCTKASSSTNSSGTVVIGTWNAPTESTWNCSCYVYPLNSNGDWTASLTYGGHEQSPCPVRLQVGGDDWSSCKNITRIPVCNSDTTITLTKTVLENQPLCVTLSAAAGLKVRCIRNIISTIVSTVQAPGTAGTAGTSTTNTPETTTNSQESDTETIVVIVVVCFVVVVIITIASVCIIKFRKRRPKKEVKDDKEQKDPDYDVTTITDNWLYHVDMNDVTSTTPTPIYHDIDEPLNNQSTESTETRGYELVHGTSPSYIILGLNVASGL